jgi:hypothetical protein
LDNIPTCVDVIGMELPRSVDHNNQKAFTMLEIT